MRIHDWSHHEPTSFPGSAGAELLIFMYYIKNIETLQKS